MQGPGGELSERPQTPPLGGNSAMLLFSPPAAVGPACGRSDVQAEEEGQCPPGTKGGRRELYLSSLQRDKPLTCVLRVR